MSTYLRHKRQNGQAMTEFIVSALFFLLPLFLGIIVLGKLSDVRHTATQASRYAAWERTVWNVDDDGGSWSSNNNPNAKTNQQIKNEIALRIINNPESATIKFKNSDKNATTFENGQKSLWRDQEGKNYLEDYNNDIQHSAVIKDSPGALSSAMGLLNSIPGAGTIGLPNLPVPVRNMQVQTVSFNVAKNSDVYKRLFKDTSWNGPGTTWNGLQVQDTSAIVTNTWMPNGAYSNQKVVRGLVPTASNSPLTTILDLTVKASMASIDPMAMGFLDFGTAINTNNIDLVPEDRLH